MTDSNSNTKQFISLLVANQKRIQAFILYLVPNRTDADDLFQETLTEMWNKFSQYQENSNFAAWGLTIARFKIMNYQSQHRVSKLCFQSDTLELLDNAFSSDNPQTSTQELIESLKECVLKLSPKEKMFLSLRYDQNQTYHQIAGQFGVTIQSVYKAIGRIHAALARCVRRATQAGGGQ